MRLKDDYIAANCCHPTTDDQIVGYYSYNNVIKIHKIDCPNLDKSEKSRLVSLAWPDIVAPEEFKPDADYHDLDKTDFNIMAHHRDYGFDYTLKMAAMLHLEKQTVFDHHNKLREMGLLQRVEPKMIQYRKNIVKGKWIKHRNHTYYDLTDKGRKYLEYYLRREKE